MAARMAEPRPLSHQFSLDGSLSRYRYTLGGWTSRTSDSEQGQLLICTIPLFNPLTLCFWSFRVEGRLAWLGAVTVEVVSELSQILGLERDALEFRWWAPFRDSIV